MRISIFILVFVLTLAITEVTSVDEVRDFVRQLIKEVLEPFSSPSEHYHDHPKDLKQPDRKDHKGHPKETHKNLLHKLKKPSTVGDHPKQTEKETYTTTTPSDENTSPWEVEVHNNASYSESPLKKTLDPPANFSVPNVGAYEHGTTSLPLPTVADTITPAMEETEPHLNPAEEFPFDGIFDDIDSIISEVDKVNESHSPIQKDIVFDIYLPSIPDRFLLRPQQEMVVEPPEMSTVGIDNYPGTSTVRIDMDIRDHGDWIKSHYDDNDADSDRVIFSGDYMTPKPASWEDGYTLVVGHD